MKKNRFQLQQMLDGVRASLTSATDKLASMYEDTTSTIEAREKQTLVVKDLEEREKGINAQIEQIDKDAQAKLAAQNANPDATPKENLLNAKADLIRGTIKHDESVKGAAIKTLGGSYKLPIIKNALADNTTTGGSNLIPKTTANEIITEPTTKNKVRDYCVVTNEANLEVPKITFSIDDDEYIEDGQTAKEIEATGSTVAFGRHKSKVFCDVSETMILGSNANLVATVDNALTSGIVAKERKMMYAKSTDTYYTAAAKHMSFYAKDDAGSNYLIATASGTTKLKAIKAAIADLHEDFRENANVIMTYADYLDIIESLANGSATLYAAQPEQILGKPAIFCDSATIPVVGDISYLQINYHPDTIYDTDKNVKTGMNTFVVTAWYDIQFRLRSAFRLAIVTP